MIASYFLHLIPFLSILVDESLSTHHSINRNIKRVHPRHIKTRGLIDYASSQLKDVESSLIPPPISSQQQAHTDKSKTKSSVVTHQKGSLLGLNASISVGVSSSGSGYYPTTYKLKSESSGKTFFDHWDFFTDADPTHGLVAYQPADSAWKSGLVSLGQNTLSSTLKGKASTAIANYPLTARMKVDSTSWLGDGQNRKSVRITSKAQFKYGLLILDAIRMPYGCSTWPAFWTVGEDWPNQGEIDIVEGVNMLDKNQMTLHTSAGCSIMKTMGANATGQVYDTNCDVTANQNAGCGVGDSNSESYGEGFNNAGGGVFAMEWKSSGISIWRFSRTSIPDDISSKQPNPEKWSQPAAHWDSTHCGALRDQFGQHRIVFDITVCGDWAGGAFGSSGCSGSCAEAMKDPSNFSNAEWEIASVQLYQ
ncbi:family 16 glycoside hydrolase [Melampsora larici-populina 98AG31]|uniref:Family 16 glycoside hydrolase n=1 Tax=Melampsora larici-populina (strain 98AG31 / pathotype 3-4-7) TaxID=747676 RepID=F4R5E2_MELLP|nr:family 16 glycoside hydrolase [Melampsora larici-populina 98AG31]EGG12275.1 family 16 glycoside hydrolase [Melampsora larici-populina 98AG31]